MTCQGCANAVNRVLTKIPGVESVAADVPAKLVTVKGTAEPQVMLEALQKWGTAAGKAVELKA